MDANSPSTPSGVRVGGVTGGAVGGAAAVSPASVPVRLADLDASAPNSPNVAPASRMPPRAASNATAASAAVSAAAKAKHLRQSLHRERQRRLQSTLRDTLAQAISMNEVNANALDEAIVPSRPRAKTKVVSAASKPSSPMPVAASSSAARSAPISPDAAAVAAVAAIATPITKKKPLQIATRTPNRKGSAASSPPPAAAAAAAGAAAPSAASSPPTSEERKRRVGPHRLSIEIASPVGPAITAIPVVRARSSTAAPPSPVTPIAVGSQPPVRASTFSRMAAQRTMRSPAFLSPQSARRQIDVASSPPVANSASSPISPPVKSLSNASHSRASSRDMRVTPAHARKKSSQHEPATAAHTHVSFGRHHRSHSAAPTPSPRSSHFDLPSPAAARVKAANKAAQTLRPSDFAAMRAMAAAAAAEALAESDHDDDGDDEVTKKPTFAHANMSSAAVLAARDSDDEEASEQARLRRYLDGDPGSGDLMRQDSIEFVADEIDVQSADRPKHGPGHSRAESLSSLMHIIQERHDAELALKADDKEMAAQAAEAAAAAQPKYRDPYSLGPRPRQREAHGRFQLWGTCVLFYLAIVLHLCALWDNSWLENSSTQHGIKGKDLTQWLCTGLAALSGGIGYIALLMRAHGYEFATNAFKVVAMCGLVAQGVLGLASEYLFDNVVRDRVDASNDTIQVGAGYHFCQLGSRYVLVCCALMLWQEGVEYYSRQRARRLDQRLNEFRRLRAESEAAAAANQLVDPQALLTCSKQVLIEIAALGLPPSSSARVLAAEGLSALVKRLFDDRDYLSRGQRRLVWASNIFFFVIYGGGMFYSELEGWNARSSVDFVIASLTTIGYGNMAPQTDVGRVFMFFFFPLGFAVVGYTVSTWWKVVLFKLDHRVSFIASWIARKWQEHREREEAILMLEELRLREQEQRVKIALRVQPDAGMGIGSPLPSGEYAAGGEQDGEDDEEYEDYEGDSEVSQIGRSRSSRGLRHDPDGPGDMFESDDGSEESAGSAPPEKSRPDCEKESLVPASPAAHTATSVVADPHSGSSGHGQPSGAAIAADGSSSTSTSGIGPTPLHPPPPPPDPPIIPPPPALVDDGPTPRATSLVLDSPDETSSMFSAAGSPSPLSDIKIDLGSEINKAPAVAPDAFASPFSSPPSFVRGTPRASLSRTAAQPPLHKPRESAQSKEARKERARIIKLFCAVLFSVAWLLFSAGIFSALEGWRYFDSIWFCYVTLTTIGYGDFYPTDRSTAFFMWFVIFGLGSITYILTLLSDMILESAAKMQLDEAKKKAKAKAKKARQRAIEAAQAEMEARRLEEEEMEEAEDDEEEYFEEEEDEDGDEGGPIAEGEEDDDEPPPAAGAAITATSQAETTNDAAATEVATGVIVSDSSATVPVAPPLAVPNAPPMAPPMAPPLAPPMGPPKAPPMAPPLAPSSSPPVAPPLVRPPRRMSVLRSHAPGLVPLPSMKHDDVLSKTRVEAAMIAPPAAFLELAAEFDAQTKAIVERARLCVEHAKAQVQAASTTTTAPTAPTATSSPSPSPPPVFDAALLSQYTSAYQSLVAAEEKRRKVFEAQWVKNSVAAARHERDSGDARSRMLAQIKAFKFAARDRQKSGQQAPPIGSVQIARRSSRFIQAPGNGDAHAAFLASHAHGHTHSHPHGHTHGVSIGGASAGHKRLPSALSESESSSSSEEDADLDWDRREEDRHHSRYSSVPQAPPLLAAASKLALGGVAGKTLSALSPGTQVRLLAGLSGDVATAASSHAPTAYSSPMDMAAAVARMLHAKNNNPQSASKQTAAAAATTHARQISATLTPGMMAAHHPHTSIGATPGAGTLAPTAASSAANPQRPATHRTPSSVVYLAPHNGDENASPSPVVGSNAPVAPPLAGTIGAAKVKRGKRKPWAQRAVTLSKDQLSVDANGHLVPPSASGPASASADDGSAAHPKGARRVRARQEWNSMDLFLDRDHADLQLPEGDESAADRDREGDDQPSSLPVAGLPTSRPRGPSTASGIRRTSF